MGFELNCSFSCVCFLFSLGCDLPPRLLLSHLLMEDTADVEVICRQLPQFEEGVLAVVADRILERLMADMVMESV